MTESILNHKKLLIVDDETDILAVVEAEILESCPDSKIDKATSYEKAAELLKLKDYDLVILDIMGVSGFDLLEIAITRKFKVAMFTARELSPDALKKSHDMGAMAYLPKEKMGKLVPYLENVLKYDYKTGWKRLLKELEEDYNRVLGHGWKENAGITYWY
jgi:DNA-binding response OmpR family regulator